MGFSDAYFKMSMTPSRVEQIKLKEMMKICPQKVNKTINLAEETIGRSVEKKEK
jgi:hypothetical protein